jgi:hypothetical protein
MGYEPWQKLPQRFLKMKYTSWGKLDYDVKQLVVELANSQRFKCALCSETDGLVIEHDHEKTLNFTLANLIMYMMRAALALLSQYSWRRPETLFCCPLLLGFDLFQRDDLRVSQHQVFLGASFKRLESPLVHGLSVVHHRH